MELQNLLSGLLGGVIGGVLGLVGALIVVEREQQRWKRENRSAALLVATEVWMTRTMISHEDFDGYVLRSLGTKAWDAEQVRVACLLTPEQTNDVAQAYFSVSTILQQSEAFTLAELDEFLRGQSGQKEVAELKDKLLTAAKILYVASGMARVNASGDLELVSPR